MADDYRTLEGQVRLAQLLAGLNKKKQNPFNVPFTGLRNEPAPALPAFEQPGTVAAQYMPSHGLEPTMPPTTVTAAPLPPPTAPPPQPEPQPGGQGFAGVEPPPGSMPPGVVPQDAGFDPNDPRYLPEHWRGTFASNLRS